MVGDDLKYLTRGGIIIPKGRLNSRRQLVKKYLMGKQQNQPEAARDKQYQMGDTAIGQRWPMEQCLWEMPLCLVRQHKTVLHGEMLKGQ